MNDPARLLLVDAPSLPLEEDLPLLERLGYECVYLPSPQDVEVCDPPPDAILVGQEIHGGAHGTDFARIAALYPGIPLLIVAHLRSLTSAIEFFRAGATDYLLAPLDPDDTRQRIDLAIARARQPAAIVEEPVEVPATLAAPSVDTTAMARLAYGLLDLEQIPCGILVCDEEGRLLQANGIAVALFGQLSTEALRLAMEETFEQYRPLDLRERPLPPEAWPITRARKDKAFRTAVVSIERPNANRIWLRIDASPCMEDGKLIFVVASINNITEERREIQRLREGVGVRLEAVGCRLEA